MWLPLRLFLLVTFIIFILLGGVECNESLPCHFNFTGFREEKINLSLDFNGYMYFAFLSLPSNGYLHAYRKNIKINKEYYFASLITYTSLPFFPTDEEVQAVEIFPISFLPRKGGDKIKKNICITIKNRNLSTPDVRFRITNSSTTQVFEIPVKEFSRYYVSASYVKNKVKFITITNLPSNNNTCTLIHYGTNSKITQVPAIINSSNRNWYIIMKIYNLDIGENCTFIYTATHKNGITSLPGKFIVERMKPYIPIVYNRNISIMIDKREQTTEIIIRIGGHSRNIISKIMNISIISLPKYGIVSIIHRNLRSNSMSEFLPLNKSDLPINFTIYNITAIIYLKYQISNTELIPLLKKGPIFDNLTYIAKDDFNYSNLGVINFTFINKSSPLCSNTTISPVFYDRPVRNIQLNYTLPPGTEVANVVLIKTPKNPIGDIWYKVNLNFNNNNTYNNNEMSVPLRKGNYFTDEPQSLQYIVRSGINNVVSNQTYEFQVRASGLSCFGTITFVIVPHDLSNKSNNSLIIYRDFVRIDSYTILSLIWNKFKYLNSLPIAIEILKVPKFGTLYTISSSTVIDNNNNNNNNEYINLSSTFSINDSFCFIHDCNRIKNETITPGRIIYFSENFNNKIRNQLSILREFFFLYKSPQINPNNLIDIIEYRFVDENYTKLITEELQLQFQEEELKQKRLTYSIENKDNSSSFYTRKIRKVIFPEVPEEEVIMIEDLELASQHVSTQRFTLFQCEKNGNKTMIGDIIYTKTKNNFTGYWINKDNTVFILTSLKKPIMFIRVRVFRVSFNGNILYNESRSYRAIVGPQNESKVIWKNNLITEKGNIITSVQKEKVINLFAFDILKEGFLVRVHNAPQWGRLQFIDVRFVVSKPILIRKGSILNIPLTYINNKGIANLTFEYLCQGGANWIYPIQDNFSLIIDSGDVEYSAPIIINITINNDDLSWLSQVSVPGHLRTVAISLFLFLLASSLIFFARLSWRRTQHARYMFLPVELTSR